VSLKIKHRYADCRLFYFLSCQTTFRGFGVERRKDIDITVVKDQPMKIALGLKKIKRTNVTITPNSGLFPLNYGNLAVNMRVINLST